MCACCVEVLFKVYCSDHTYSTIRVPVAASVREVIGAVTDKLGSGDDLLLIHLKSAGGENTHTQTIFPFLSPLTAISSVFIGVWLIAGWLIPCLQSVLLHWLLSLWPLAHNMSSLLLPSCCSISHSASQCCCSRQTLHTHCQLRLLQGLKLTFSLNRQFGY